jgi:hypothetical protein
MFVSHDIEEKPVIQSIIIIIIIIMVRGTVVGLGTVCKPECRGFGSQ